MDPPSSSASSFTSPTPLSSASSPSLPSSPSSSCPPSLPPLPSPKSQSTHSGTFRLPGPASPSSLALSWAVLLKDYLGTTSVKFLLTDKTCSSGSSRSKAIYLELTGEETAGELLARIGQQPGLEADHDPTNEIPSLQSHLFIVDSDETVFSSDHEIDSGEASCFEQLDIKLQCNIHSEERTRVDITTQSRSSSRQTARLLRQLEAVLQQTHLPTVGEKLVSKIDTASDSDIREIWTQNARIPGLPEGTALDVFADHVCRTPEALAIHAWDGSLTYEELDRRSTALSEQLAKLGVQKGVIVPLCFEKSSWTPVAIFGVIKTGATFVLLDEDLPPERLKQLAQLIADETVVVLTSAAQQHRADLLGSAVMVVDAFHLGKSQPMTEVSNYRINPTSALPSDIIYIVFTSGTTGVPKAAQICHSNICFFASSVGDLSNVSRSSRVLALASYAYDVSLGNVFLALLNGATLCIPSSWECRNDVARLVNGYGATHLQTTPSVSRLLQGPADARGLEVLDLCGEPCSEDALARWRGSSTRVMNTYSPAECTVTSVANPDVLAASKSSIIGHGLGACWIMDLADRERLAPIGGVGELVLEGPLVGAGYLHNEKSTREAFLENPGWLLRGLPAITPGRCGRLYRTGDLVRYTDDLQIDYIGRRDSQVKIRGQRVELGEVAAHLQMLIEPSMQWCLEVAKLKNGIELLVVFLVAPTASSIGESGATRGATNLLRVTADLVDPELRRKLPPAMVPGAYASIERIPLSLTGKTDHGKLKQAALSLSSDSVYFPNLNSHDDPRPSGITNNYFNSNSYQTSTGGNVSLDGSYSVWNGHPHGINIYDSPHGSPRSPSGSESSTKLETLRSVWSEVFNVEAHTIQDSDIFFSYGGESLAAIRLVSAASRKGLQLDVATIFRHPRLADLASQCRLSHTSLSDPPLPFSLLPGRGKSLAELATLCNTFTDNIEDAYPCTALQQGLVATSSSSSSSDTRQQRPAKGVASYVGRQVIPIPQHIDQDRLAGAWRRVSQAHAILRTRIVDTLDDGLIQVVLRDTCPEARRSSLEAYLREDDARPMGLGTELCRWAIVCQESSSSEAWFVLTMHHAIYDGWTLPRLGAEVFRAYRGERLHAGIGFNVFMKHVSMLPTELAEDFWARRLAGPGTTAAFPDVPHSIGQPRADSSLSKTIPAPNNANDTTSMPSLLRAAWALLTAKLSGSDDVVFGATVSGRNMSVDGIEDMLGPTIATVPVRVRIDGAMTVRGFVESVQNEALEAMPFEHIGLQNIHKISTETRSRSRFQTLLIIYPPTNTTSSTTTIQPPPSAVLSPVEQDLQTVLENIDLSTGSSLSNFNEYALMLLISQNSLDNSLTIEASYDSRVLDETRVSCLLSQLSHVAVQLGEHANLGRRLDSLPLANRTEVEAISAWNRDNLDATAAALAEGGFECVHNLIARSIATNPDAEAVCAWDGRLTYAQLDRFAEQLSRLLRLEGVGRGSLVPICMEKSMWAAVAMLAVLRAGAAFVAMDVQHQPKERLRAIVRETGAAVIVSTRPSAELARELAEGGPVVICDEAEEPGQEWTQSCSSSLLPSPSPSTNPMNASHSDPAFIVFTSGSTGTPKGIIITHSNFSTTVALHPRELHIYPSSRIYDYASYSFDIAVHNALMALSVGATLCIPNEHDRINNIEESFSRLGANWVDLTPSVARILDPRLLIASGLRTLVLSGEAVGRDVIDLWSGKVANFINAYGPAECQICTVQPRLLPGLQDVGKIGRGLGCATWIVDPETGRELLPIGAVGELVIEGPIVSPGYLNTASTSFMSNPPWLRFRRASSTAYRTGDLVRYLPDGSIVYVGRATAQAKVNGQRVDLGEIEFHVRQALHPSTKQVAVEVATTTDGHEFVCAFLTVDSGAQTTAADRVHSSSVIENELVAKLAMLPPCGLQDKLRTVLPAAMVPSAFVEVSRLPLTATGKVDRRRLKEHASKLSREEILLQSSSLSESHVVAPVLDGDQRRMRDIWGQILKVDPARINLQSDFFQHGGDSISAMRLVKTCRDNGLVLTVADVLRHPRLEDLCRQAQVASIVAQNSTNGDTIESSQGPAAPIPQKQRQTAKRLRPFSLLPEDSDRKAWVKSAAAACNVRPHHIIDMYPCTPFQEGVLALTAADPSAYVQHTELRLCAGADFDRVLAAWDATIASNPILRTRVIQSDSGRLLQVVIRESAGWERYESLQEYLEDTASTPMGLGTPLSRLVLIESVGANQPQSIVWTIHHALYDSWTTGLVLDKVAGVYHERDHEGDEETGSGYNVFVQHVLDQQEASASWWKSALMGASDAAIFPKTASIAATGTMSSCSSNSAIRKDVALPRTMRPGYSTAVLLRSAWAVLMARHTGSSKVLFGETRLGRQATGLSGVETMCGPTIATVPLLVDIEQDQSVSSILKNIRETGIQMDAFEHFGLQNIARVSEDGKSACGFQTLLVVQGARGEDRHGLDVMNEERIFELDDSIDDLRNFGSYHMTIVFNQTSSGIIVDTVFRESVISADLVDHLLSQFESVFYSLCESSPNTMVRQLDFAGNADLDRIWKWNAATHKAVDKMMHDIVSAQAVRTPEELAVLAHDGQMTYRELDRCSSDLAVHLCSRGLGVGSFVPICLEKSLWAPVAMMGVLKTGAAFSIMDVSHPEDRLKSIAKSLEARIILSSPTQLDLARRIADEVIVVDAAASTSWNRHGVLRDNAGFSLLQAVLRDSNSIMYVCFTSGSTGTPKGVMVTHKNLASAAVPQVSQLGFGPGDRVYDFSSHAFDAHIWHTWWALISGATLCIPSHADRLGNLAGSMAAFGSTIAFLTPSVARTIDPTDVPTLKKLFLGGEAVAPSDVVQWGSRLALSGGYGPTEATPVSIFHWLRKPEDATIIGKAIGLNTWICNPDNIHELIAVGAVGELVLEGPLVSLGYLGDPERTSAAFFEDPAFLQTRGRRRGRLYRTGDLVRYAGDGSIEYLGRADTQVKLRGQRVEFGEIEYHLARALLPADGNDAESSLSIVCDVVSHPLSGRQTLVAFCAPKSSASMEEVADDAQPIVQLPSEAAVAARSRIGKRLPAYMIPEVILSVKNIPTNRSGKVDRQRLKLLGRQMLQRQHTTNNGASLSNDEGASTNPLTAMETRLSKLWKYSILGLSTENIGPDSDFFEVGGDSIAAMKLSNLARRQDLSLPVQTILQQSKLSAMAQQLCLDTDISNTPTKSLNESCPSPPGPFSLIPSDIASNIIAVAAEACRISPASIEDIYPCTPLQTELFALTQRQSCAYVRRAVYSVPARVDIGRVVRAWDVLAARHAILRTRFVHSEALGCLVQVVVKGGAVWDDEKLCRQGLREYLATTLERKIEPGRLLSQLALVREKGTGGVSIVWTVHHAAYDGWSVQILDDQLRLAYCNAGGLSTRPPTLFSSFVRHVISLDASAAKRFWNGQLQGCSSTTTATYPPLPSSSSNYQPQPVATYRCTIALPGSSNKASLQATIHAAWALIVSVLTERDDVVFAATLAGRDAAGVPGIEHIVGPTIAPVPIRIRFQRERPQSIGALLSEIETSGARTVPFQHFGTRNIEAVSADAKAACRLMRTLIVVTPQDDEEEASSKDGEQNLVRTSSYEIEDNDKGAFHTFPLALFFTPGSKGKMGLEMVFDPALLNNSEVERLGSRLEAVITSLLDGHNNKLVVSDIECIGKEDLNTIWQWNSILPAANERLVHDIILNGGRNRQESIAITAWDRDISYRQLDRFSQALAGRLITHHAVGRGSVIPIIMPKSAFVHVSALAVLRTGAAFLPLDVTQPPNRLKSVIDQVNPIVILALQSSSKLAASICDDTPTILMVDDYLNGLGDEITLPLPTENCANCSDVACILFTSGSTGTPKGVLQTHSALSTAIAFQSSASGFSTNTRAFEFASYAFDVSWNVFFKTLAAGGTLCVPSDTERLDDLAGAIARSGATLTELTASVARLLKPEHVPTLKTLILSGEAVDLSEFQHWRPQTKIVVCYGPSECTSVSTMNGTALEMNGTGGIGKGSACVTWIVDPQNHRRLMPIGAVGELLIEGPIVGQGYYNNEELTQSRYISDPPTLICSNGNSRSDEPYFHQSGTRRAFKSGDLVRYDPHGNLHFVARKDMQAKLHGQRIELEEVQHHVRALLDGHQLGWPIHVVASVLNMPKLEQVASSPDSHQRQALVVFLSCEVGEGSQTKSCVLTESPTPSALDAVYTLDEALGTTLPKYMVPSAYFFISTIPRTTNGKVDRTLLLQLATHAEGHQVHRGRKAASHDGQQQEMLKAKRAVTHPAEQSMQRIWSSVLGVAADSLGGDDAFVDVGGDSVSAMRLVAAARRAGFDISVADLFSPHATIAESALKIRDGHKIVVHASNVNDLDHRSSAAVDEGETAILPFSLLAETGSPIDVASARAEIAAKCGVADLNMVEDAYPCTPLQESMLAASLREPGAFVSMRLYHIPKGIDSGRLREAWESVVDRNRILRTRLVDLKVHGINQVVLHEKAAWTRYGNMGSFLEEAKGTLLPEMGQDGSPLMRLAFIEEEGQPRRLVWIIHHALYDGWVLPMIEHELRMVYLGTALEPPRPDIRPLVQQLRQGGGEDGVSYWRRELEAAEEGVAIFPPLPNHAYIPHPDGYIERSFAVGLSKGKSTLATSSLSSFFYASWAVLMSRLAGMSRVSFGATLTGRNAGVDDIDRLMGPTITTVPILIEVTGDSSSEFMARLRQKALRMMPHEHVGINAIRRASTACEAACSFQTVLVIQPPVAANDKTMNENGSTDLVVMEELDETKIAGYPDQHGALNQHGLMMEILPKVENSSGLSLTVRASFDSTLIPAPRMDRLIRQWEHVMEQIWGELLLHRAEPIPSPLPLGTELLCRQDVNDVWTWNKDRPASVEDSLVHDVVSALAQAQPSAPAIDAWDGQLTYRELDHLSSKLARHLARQYGVGIGTYVPLLFPKSLWANVSMLAVLKAGGAFVPLDASHPEGRLRAVLQPLAADVVLCAAETRDRAARLAQNALLVNYTTIAALSDDETEDESQATTPSLILSDTDTAYAVFTSGSTGAAKGVRISHGNLATAIHHQAGPGNYKYGIVSSSRTLDSSSYAFDACVCNFFYTITQVGCLCVPSEQALKGDIASFMRDFRVNWAQLVPSVARTVEPDALPQLQTLVLTGEPLARGDIETWAPRLRLINAYGPTECTILCAISARIEEPGQTGNIGKGRGANLWLAELGNPQRLAPVGAVGEVLIEGPIIGLGYLGPYQYPLVEDPAWLLAGSANMPGRRGVLFRTGDQARYNPDGTLTFVGRIGTEVKLRGQRVDLVGVEDVCRRYMPAGVEIVAEVVNVGWGVEERLEDRGDNNIGGRPERQMLLLFASGSEGPERYDAARDTKVFANQLETLVGGLRTALDAVLPAYLQPEAIAVMDSIPHTSSAKADRGRLRGLAKKLRPQQLIWLGGELAARSSSTSTPPHTPEEKVLAALWACVLRIESSSISREDDFFRLGGDSLAVMRLATAAHEAGIVFKAADVFKSSRLSTLALKITTRPQLKGLPSRLADDGSANIDYKAYSLVNHSISGSVEEFIQTCVLPELGVSRDEVEDVMPANGFQVDYMHNEEEPLGLQYAYLDISPRTSWPRLVDACRTVVQTFQCLRARFVLHHEKYYQVVLRTAPLLVEELVSDEQVTTFSNRFCPADGRAARATDILTKLTLVTFGDKEGQEKEHRRRRVILRMSHMQNDGWCTIRILQALQDAFNGDLIAPTPEWTELLHHRACIANDSRAYWRRLLDGTTGATPPLVYKPRDHQILTTPLPAKRHGVRTLRTHALPNFHDAARDNRRTRPTVVVNVAWALVLQQLAGGLDDIVFGNVTTGRNGAGIPGLDAVIGPCVNMLPTRFKLPRWPPADEAAGSTSGTEWIRASDNNEERKKQRRQLLRELIEASAAQVDDRAVHEGLDWDDMVDHCTAWPSGERYRSAVHFRNMAFEPELLLNHGNAEKTGSGSESGGGNVDRLVVAWYELVAMPHWTTVLVYPEDNVVRLWLLADPTHIGDDGADEILQLLAAYVDEITAAIAEGHES